MMKFYVNSEAISDAVNRCTTITDGYRICFKKRQANPEGYVFATINASTDNSCSNIQFLAKPEQCATKEFFVSRDFASAIRALSQSGKELIFNLDDKSLVLSYHDDSDTEIKLPLMNEITPGLILRKPENMVQKEVDGKMVKEKEPVEHISFKIDTKEFKRVISQGGFAYGNISEDNPRAYINNLLLMPLSINNRNLIRIGSISGPFCTSSAAAVTEVNKKFLSSCQLISEAGNDATSICFSPSSIYQICKVLKGESLLVRIYDNQMVIEDTNDIFALALGALPFRCSAVTGIVDDTANLYSFKTSVEDLKVAVNILNVGSSRSDINNVHLTINGPNVLLSAENGNRVTLNCTNVEGRIDVVFNSFNLLKVLSNGITEVNTCDIFGTTAKGIIHVIGGHCSAGLGPVVLKKSTDS